MAVPCSGQCHSCPRQQHCKANTYSNIEALETYHPQAPLHAPPPNRGIKGLGIAIDIGTTTLAFALVDMVTGHTIATHSQGNSQLAYGGDVVSRIHHATHGHMSQLNIAITSDIIKGIGHILSYTSAAHITSMAITGNTTMLQLLLNLPCNGLMEAPFTPAITGIRHYAYTDIFPDHTLQCDVLILPIISAFVGADISAGLIASGWPNVQGYQLLLDIGTNGEMALFTPDTIYVTATAAGPAFEGASISCGVSSIPGAITRANFYPTSHVFSFETIADEEPIGICGTGVIDICAALITHRLVDETGFIESGEDKIYITPSIAFTQRDIREVQLAKSAIRSGIEVLRTAAGIQYQDIANVFLAGGFGYKMSPTAATTLGLIPQELTHKITAIGNGALGGCIRVLLSSVAQDNVARLATMATEINLATHPSFGDYFMDYMGME